ncbi:hypothetical protein GCM10022406_15870 [Hymenobacter algoricola]|uniref:Uncharacterized protein n=1 Tax=Hymenobacter algoricola TaxID=486267 RepID=A0ABP7MZT0_9BACT
MLGELRGDDGQHFGRGKPGELPAQVEDQRLGGYLHNEGRMGLFRAEKADDTKRPDAIRRRKAGPAVLREPKKRCGKLP